MDMLDMLYIGFADQVEEILSVARFGKQFPNIALFLQLALTVCLMLLRNTWSLRKNRWAWLVKKTQRVAITMDHLAINCHWTEKAAIIGNVIWMYSGYNGHTILFTETKEAQDLSQNAPIHQDAQSLHRDIPQYQREITLKDLETMILAFWSQPMLLLVG